MTAYEMRISDWSSDVCSSDLLLSVGRPHARFGRRGLWQGRRRGDPERHGPRWRERCGAAEGRGRHHLCAGARKLRDLGDAGRSEQGGYCRRDAEPRRDRADARRLPAKAQAMMGGGNASESAYRVLMGVLESRTGQTLSPHRLRRIEMSLKPVMQRHGIEDIDALVAALVTSTSRQLLDNTVDALLNNETFSYRDHSVFDDIRSEEHTSELPSLMRLSYAVFCLKTKTKITTTPNPTQYKQTHTTR